MRYTGVVSRGIITPIFQEGEDLLTGIAESVAKAAEMEGFALYDRDIVGVTEAVVARTQGNYATCAQIAQDVREKFGGGPIGVLFPIMSRNRFAVLLKAFAMAAEKVYVQLSYPSDEVGNALICYEQMEEKGVNPYSDSFTKEEFRQLFGTQTVHTFTGVDYIAHYEGLADNIEIVLSNQPEYLLQYTRNILCCDIHTRFRTYQKLKKQNANVYRMDQILTQSVAGSGYNPEFGLLGANKATENRVKLFPRDTQVFAEHLAEKLLARTGRKMEVLVYGDGGFKDPVGGIWELADPVVSPGYTAGLKGTPSELKMKYFADNEFSALHGESLAEAMRKQIRQKDQNLVGNMESQGTTPRRLIDLVGSLCDLTSGSGDRGTPVVLIQGYFSNFATE